MVNGGRCDRKMDVLNKRILTTYNGKVTGRM